MRRFFDSPIFRVWPLSQFDAICIGRWMFFRNPAGQVSIEMLQHEMVHQSQMDRYGVVQFYVMYLTYWFMCMLRYWDFYRAYRENPLEKEAYGDDN